MVGKPFKYDNATQFWKIKLKRETPALSRKEILNEIEKKKVSGDFQKGFDLYNAQYENLYQIWFKKISPDNREKYMRSVMADDKKSRKGRPKGAPNKRKTSSDSDAQINGKKSKSIQVPETDQLDSGMISIYIMKL